MNAVLKQNRFDGNVKAECAQPSAQRVHRYDSPEQERLAKIVLEKHKATLRNLAK